MLSFPTYKRYSIKNVFLVVLAVSFALFLLAYGAKMAVGGVFNWTAYREYLRNQVLGTVATSLFFYFFLNLFHRLFAERNNKKDYFLPALFAILVVEAYNLLMDHYLPLTSNVNDPLPFVTQVLGNLLLGLFYLGMALLIAYVNNLRDLRKKHRLLQEQQLKLEVEKTEADLNFLRSQINPHFLHNTLNSFYARSLPLSKELAEGILTLSEIMRYSLEETATPDGKVFLRDEITHLQKVIRLNQFRFRNHLQIGLEVNGLLNGARIIPFVLITLVENIFKHADLSDSRHPIRIKMDVQGDAFRYYCRNKKKKGPKELSTGVGLDNIKKRMDIVYGSGYALNISETEEFYSTELVIT